MRCNGDVITNGRNIFLGERMTVTADSNPGKRNYTWENTTSNEIIATGDSIAVTEQMVGNQSFKAVVCNTIPLPSPHTVCSDFSLNVVVIGKCVSIIVIVLGESECSEHCKTFNVERFQSLLTQPSPNVFFNIGKYIDIVRKSIHCTTFSICCCMYIIPFLL